MNTSIISDIGMANRGPGHAIILSAKGLYNIDISDEGLERIYNTYIEVLMDERFKLVYNYKGYTTHARKSTEDSVIYGKIENIKDLIDFDSETIEGFEKEFHKAVDNYIASCEKIGKGV